jgi:SAM-dependent methyltransferase
MTRYDEAELYSGLAALMWASYDEPGWDHDFYRRVIERGDGAALDVGCGTGRLLRSYLRAGLDVDGCDIAADMLAVCAAKAEAEGLKVQLYNQAMQHLDLPRRYRTIYIPCGSFMLVMDRAEADEALVRFRDHLRPGGTLAFNIYLPDFDHSTVKAAELPGPWQPRAENHNPDGTMLKVFRRAMSVDLADQRATEERRLELWRGEELLKQELRAGQERWYGKHEMLLMLERAGFRDVQVKGDYTDEEFGPQHSGTMVFVARR